MVETSSHHSRVPRAPHTASGAPTAERPWLDTRIDWPGRPARTCSSTRTTRSTGTPGARRPSHAPAAKTSRSSSASATPPATGATSWSASRSRTRRSRALMNDHFVQHQGGPRGAARRRPHLHERRADDDRPRRLADDRVSHAGRQALLRRHLLPARGPPRPARLPRACSQAVAQAYRERPRRGGAAGGQAAGQPARRRTRPSRPDTALDAGIVLQAAARRSARAYDPTTAASAGRRSSPTSRLSRSFSAPVDGTGDGRCLDMVAHTLDAWPAAASTTTSAAASTATRSTRNGWCPTSRRCSTTTRSLSALYLDAYQATGDGFFGAVAARHPRLRAARDARSRPAASTRPRTPTARARRASSSSGPSTRCSSVLGDDDAELFCRYYDVTDVGQLRGQEHPPPRPRDRAARQALPDSREEVAAGASPRRGESSSRRAEQRIKPGLRRQDAHVRGTG